MKGRSQGLRDALAAFRGGLPPDLAARVRWDALTEYGNLHFRTPERGALLAIRRLLTLGLALRVVSAGDGWVDAVTVAREVEFGKPWEAPADGANGPTGDGAPTADENEGDAK